MPTAADERRTYSNANTFTKDEFTTSICYSSNKRTWKLASLMMLCTFGAEDDRWSTMFVWPFDGISMPWDSFLQTKKQIKLAEQQRTQTAI